MSRHHPLGVAGFLALGLVALWCAFTAVFVAGLIWKRRKA